MPEPRFRIAQAHSDDDLAACASLFRTYAASLRIDLSFQNFDAELVGLPGKYAPPKGALLLARDDAEVPLGCVGLRRQDPDGCCEMKRLHVVPAARGFGIGRALVVAVIAEARRLGYREMRLDTLPTMGAAVALYRAEGFVPIAPYYDTPIRGTVFLALRLIRDT
jgi:ribosomal protein S18 acetylase RimI-like enzyme